MAKATDLERSLPRNTCNGKHPKQEAVEQLREQLEAHLNGLLTVQPGSPPPRALLDFLEYSSRVLVSVGEVGKGRGRNEDNGVLSRNIVGSEKGLRIE